MYITNGNTIILLAVLSMTTCISGSILLCKRDINKEPTQKIYFKDKLFIASKNKISSFYPTNFSISAEQALQDDCESSLECNGKPDDFNTQVMLVDAASQNVIVCGSSKVGTCLKLNMDGLSLTDQRINGIISSDKNAKVHSAIYIIPATKERQVIVGNSVSSYPGAIGEITLNFLTAFDADSFRKEIEIPYSNSFLKSNSRLDVVGSYKHSGWTYFILNRMEKGEMGSYIVRFCDRNPSLKSFQELRLECLYGDGKKFDHPAVATEKAALSEVLGKTLDIVTEDVLFVLFSGGGSSAVCVYKLESIMMEFKNLAEGCCGGKPGFDRGLFYLSDEHKAPCQLDTSTVDFWNFCKNAGPNFAMSNEALVVSNLLGHSFYPMDAAASSFLVTAANDYNVAFVATERNSVLKVKMPLAPKSGQLQQLTISSPSSSYDEWHFDSGVLGITFDDSEGIYVATENSTCQMKRAVCNHTTCDSCIVDPYCGWCLDGMKCCQRASCSKPSLWLSDECPTMVKLTPTNVSFYDFSNKKIKMEVANIPKSYSKVKCRLSVAPDPTYLKEVDVYTQSTGGVGISSFICREFSDPPTNWDGNAFINMTLTLVIDNVGWLSEPFYIYDCQKFKNCSGCLSGEVRFPCRWCIGSHACIPESDSRCQLPMLGEGKPLASEVDECPSIDFNPSQSHTMPSPSSPPSFLITGKNVKDHYKTGLSCRFGLGPSAPQSAASVTMCLPAPDENTCTIFCSTALLKYDDPKDFEVVRIDLLADPNSLVPKVIDNPNSVNLRLYKCQYMASSCGKCLLLNSSFGCAWCDPGFCGLQKDCASFLDKSSTCPNPTISDFQPNGGPLQGGTRLTIVGTNLGMKPEDVQVSLGSRPCQVVPSGYLATEQVVCNTSSVISPESTKIEVKINNVYSAVSAQPFHYKNPEPKDFTPRRGMRSGGTLVVIRGNNLDYGSQCSVTIGESRSQLISRNATHLQVVTGPNSIPKKVPVRVRVDGHELPRMADQFEYLNNPDISGISPKVSLMSGGRRMTVIGRSFDIISEPQLVVEFMGEEFVTSCVVRSATSMTCPTPDLTRHESVFIDHYALSSINTNFHFILDKVVFPFDKDFLGYYPHPVVKKFKAPVVVKNMYDEIPIETEKSEWLGEFHTDINVTVGQVRCSHFYFETTSATINFKPMDCPQKGQVDRDFPVKVNINNFSADVGFVKYPAPFRTGLVVGLILGLLLPLVFVGVVFFLWYVRKRKRLEMKMRQEARNAESNQPLQRNTNRYEGLTTNRPEESIPLTDVVDPNSFQDDAQYLEALVNRLDSQSMRSAAKEVYIARERLEIGNELGRGHFGCVYAATLRDKNLRNPMPVAVKTIDDADLDQKMMEGFLKEGIIMKNFDHSHVLSLLGLCLGYKKEPMVILPFMANGDLRSYVKAKNRSFTARQLLQLAQQVAEGMSYLASLNFIHRDLAARNCMIDDKSQVKVADFGLSHELHDREYYSSKNRRAKLPIKWMALESLENYVFTIKSDVWSFGVLLWELMTRGITPYPDVDVFETRNYLASGRRLFKPKFCPENVYGVMMDCWQESPERRPTFTDLVNRLELLLNPPRPKEGGKGENNYINVQSNDPTQDYLKPISLSPEEEQDQAAVPSCQGDDGGDNDNDEEDEEEEGSDRLSRHSGGSVEVSVVPKGVVVAGVKEASV